MIKLSDELYIEPMGKIIDDNRKAVVEKRHFQAAAHTKQNRGWTDFPMAPNYVLRCDLPTLRARARDMAKNAPHFRKFLVMVKNNVIGHKGIQLQCDAVFDSSGRPYTTLNTKIETAFWQWGQRETCTLSGKLNWVQVQRLVAETLIRDGEVLVEHVQADNPFGYSLKMWNVDWLDETHNETLRNGNRVIMGVEVDGNEKPIAYWLTEPPSTNVAGGYGYAQNKSGTRYRRRVPAEDMMHIFLATDDESQVRGFTWFHAALLQGKDFHEYGTGVVQSARVAAHTFGFLKQTGAEEVQWEGDQQACDLPPMTIDKSPLSVNLLDPGFEFQQFDPKQPTQSHAEFANSMLHTLAAGMGVTGFSLAGDMSQVNFSSARVGLGEEREVWRSLQTDIADMLCRPVFQRWLTSSWLNGRVEMQAANFLQLLEPTWRPRGWSYIEPHKDIKAAIEGIEGNLITYKEHFAERGIDLEEWLADKKKEIELFAQYGIPYRTAPDKSLPPAPPKPIDDEERGYTNGTYEN